MQPCWQAWAGYVGVGHACGQAGMSEGMCEGVHAWWAVCMHGGQHVCVGGVHVCVGGVHVCVGGVHVCVGGGHVCVGGVHVCVHGWDMGRQMGNKKKRLYKHVT